MYEIEHVDVRRGIKTKIMMTVWEVRIEMGNTVADISCGLSDYDTEDDTITTLV